MNFVNDTFKFFGMRKAQEFTIYPCLPTDEEVSLQSDTRFMKVNVKTGEGIISRSIQGGARYMHLLKEAGGLPIKLSDEDKARVKAMFEKMSRKTNPDRSIVLLSANDYGGMSL